VSRSEHFFHGTVASPEDGTVVPRRELEPHVNVGEKIVHSDPDTRTVTVNHDVAHATTSEETAWQWAELRARDKYNPGSRRSPRPSVLRVSAPDAIRANRSPMGEFDGEHVIAPVFNIEDEEHIQPGHQGTIPINWNQFRNLRGSSYGELNHPSPAYINAKQDDELDEAYSRNRDEPSIRPRTQVPGQQELPLGIKK